MDDIHLSQEILHAVEDGRVPAEILDDLKTEHLLGLCPHCRAEVQLFRAGRRAGALIRLIQILPVLFERAVSLVSLEIPRAARDLRELLALAPEERLGTLERSRSRFRSPFLVRLLLLESRQRIPSHPEEALHLAELALQAAGRNPGISGYFDLYVLCMAEMANACRVGNDRRRANELFVTARRVIAQHGVTDPEVVARVDDLMGSLRKDQRRLAEAEKLLHRAALLFGLRYASDDRARALLNLADVHWLRGNPSAAIETARSALALLGPQSDLRLHLAGHYNLTCYLVEAGQFEEAADLLEEDADLYRRMEASWLQLRLLWLRGDIAAGRGDLAAAEKAYLETRDGFAAQGIGYDAAIVSLYLAAIYLRQGRTADVRRLAEEMIPLFQAQDVHREALAALALFQEAARQDRLTVERALEIADFLRKARKDPDLRFAWRGE
jgi:hypothetical protein